MTYEQHWGFKDQPFASARDERYYFPSQNHRLALAKLCWVVEQKRSAALLTGECGTGKTMLVRRLCEQLSEEFDPICHLVFPLQDAPSLLALLAAELGVELTSSGDGKIPQHQTLRGLQGELCGNAREGRHTLIVIDEAHTLEATAAMEALRMLLNFEVDGHPALTLLLVGQPQLLANLQQLPSLDARLDMKCTLEPLSQPETVAYIQHRLETAQGNTSVFDIEALEAVHVLSGGVPSLINRLCDLALLVGFGEGLSRIGAEQIEMVTQQGSSACLVETT